ncbi:Uncharacterised protein [Chlamydia abortus]|nr:Uncharacterised protein [Chlamydia abortus]
MIATLILGPARDKTLVFTLGEIGKIPVMNDEGICFHSAVCSNSLSEGFNKCSTEPFMRNSAAVLLSWLGTRQLPCKSYCTLVSKLLEYIDPERLLMINVSFET